MSSNGCCHLVRTCPLMDNSSSKLMDDVTPEPGYVIKASASGVGMKVFVNVCKKESIEKPSPAKQVAHGGRFGLSWTIPHTLTEQVVNGSQYRQTYRVFDFQVHPDTCRMAETNSRFKSMLNELAIGAVAGEYNVHLSVRKLQFPKMKYKGVQAFTGKKDASVLRSSSGATAEVSHKQKVLNCCKQQSVKLSVDSDKSEILDQKAKPHTSTMTDVAADIDDNNKNFIVPKYAVTCLANEVVPAVNGVTFSQMLVVDIELPLVSTALAISLDVFEKRLHLTSTGTVQYKLEIDLPYVVDENHSFAKFVKSRRILCVTMPMLSSSRICTSSSESSSSTDPGEILVSNSDVNTEFVSTNSRASTEIASGQEANFIMPTKHEHAGHESVNCLTAIQFSHTQDVESVTLIFTIKGVVPSSASVSFISDTFCRIEMDKVVGDGGVLSHICCFMKFDDDCKCKDDGYTVNVTDDSVVLIVAKASQCHHMWNTFWTGPDINHLEERQFFTSACLTSSFDSQDIEPCQKESEDKAAPTVQVNSAAGDKALITVEESRNTDENVSSDIVVVHEKGVPKLHGILKQRSVSESSDDGVHATWSQVSMTTSSEGDDIEDSPDRSAASSVSSGRQVVRKSVSFSDHIDRTLFQANQSVSSMHAALKNRRRRARKREQKQEQRIQRRRRRSSGSFSLEESGDEQAAVVQTACVGEENAVETCHGSTESSECVEDSSGSTHVTSERADGSFSKTISDDAEFANEKILSSQDVLGSESSSRNGNACENEKPVESTLLKSKLASNETQNENVNYSDVLRTKVFLEDSGSEVVNDGTCDLPSVCDKTSVHVFGSDENCESDISDMDIVCDGLETSGSGSSTELSESCGSGIAVELLKVSQTADGSVAVAGSESQSSDKMPVSIISSSVFDLDVD